MDKKSDLFEEQETVGRKQLKEQTKVAATPLTPFTEEQIKELKKPLDESRIERRKAKFGVVEYLPSWDVINRANEIFGYGGWQREIKRLEKVQEREVEGTYNVSYLCECRVKVGDVVHEDVGFGSATNYSDLASAHAVAIKAAVSDSLKRCLRAFGTQFGLMLYRAADKREIEEYQPAEPRKATEGQVAKLHRELASFNLKEEDLVEYINLKMGSDFEKLEDLPIKVATRAIERFAKERDGFAKEIRSLVKGEAPF